MRWTIPNTLTVLRLFAAPGVVIMFLYFHRPWADWFALTQARIDAFADLMRPLGLLEIARTGVAGLKRGV